jgi:hypothetical protein
MIDYFKTDSRRLSYAEYWRITSSFGAFLVGAIAKLLRIPISFGHATPRTDHLVRLESTQLPPGTAEGFGRAIADCENHGLQFRFFYTIPALGPTKGVAAALLSADAQSHASLVHVRGTRSERTAFTVYSTLRDGTVLGTTNHKKQMEYPLEYQMVRLLDAPLGAIISCHRDRANAQADQIVPVTDDGLEGAIVRGNNRFIDFQVERGVFVPMSQAEIERLRRPAPVS